MARRLFSRAAELQPNVDRHRQQESLCTYKDGELPASQRLDRALQILAPDLQKTSDTETLGVAGAICKRKWELDGQLGHLERALAYYWRGFQLEPPHDHYCGVNAAFVHDLLAEHHRLEAEAAGAEPLEAEAHRGQSTRIRSRIVDDFKTFLENGGTPLSGGEWWFRATMAEALFGLGRFYEAAEQMQVAESLGVDRWMYESTIRQMTTIARLKDPTIATPEQFRASEPGRNLETIVGGRGGVFSSFIGKVGLALSGGGFRASFFHIGVLAKLAELDLLRHVEVLSCVSGGSIVGADYYLRLRTLLQSKPDDEVTRQDYIDLVEELARDFVAGVESNIRTRVVAEFTTNLRILSPSYTRTERIGELFEEVIYSRVRDGHDHGEPRYITDLFVQPPDAPAGEPFVPKRHNWLRSAKVPILILNATTLNTGHNWQFTASWMGESPFAVDPDVDTSEVFRRMGYNEAPERYRRVRLGAAVAASACVPGLFAPLELPDLYPDRTVRLVDGGVQDNQGTAALLEQECSVLLVSDAGGQLASAAQPSQNLLSVALRSQGIQNARIRAAQFADLRSRRSGRLLRGLMVVHLKKGVGLRPVNWVGCDDPGAAQEEIPPSEDGGKTKTGYGVRVDVQERLASVRTDLDSFHEAEAFSLMTSGYLMVAREFEQGRHPELPGSDAPSRGWGFLTVKDAMTGDESPTELLHLLDVSRHRAMKIWKLSPALKAVSVALGFAAIVAAVLAIWAWGDATLLRLSWLAWPVLGILAVLVLGKLGTVVVTKLRELRDRSEAKPLFPFRDYVLRVGAGIALAAGGFLLARIHLWVFDPAYLRRGRVGMAPLDPANGGRRQQ